MTKWDFRSVSVVMAAAAAFPVFIRRLFASHCKLHTNKSEKRAHRAIRIPTISRLLCEVQSFQVWEACVVPFAVVDVESELKCYAEHFLYCCSIFVLSYTESHIASLLISCVCIIFVVQMFGFPM